MKPFFEASDFIHDEYAKPEHLANHANAKLEREAIRVYHQEIVQPAMKTWIFSKEQHSSHTHQALLLNIEELPKKECEHEAEAYNHSVITTMPPKWLCDYKCVKCGVKLKATWSVVE